MTDPHLPITPPSRHRLAWATLLIGLIGVTALCLQPVAAGLSWAAVLAIVTWPLYRRLRRVLREGPTLSALLMTALVVAFIATPVAIAVTRLIGEVGPMLVNAGHWLARMPDPPAWLRNLPLLPDLWRLVKAAVNGHGTPSGEWLRPLWAPSTRALGAIARTIGQTVLAILTLFFLYRNGDRYQHHIGAIARYWLGERADGIIRAIREALQAVFVGVILAAAAQGLVATAGYVAVGLEAPVVLGAATAVLAVLPFAAVLVWGTAGVGLLIGGAWFKGMALLIWGAVAVSSIDNLVRASVLHGSAQLPYWQSLIALIGGVAVFGPLGLFIGPALLAVWIGLWQEWTHGEPAAPAGNGA